MQKKIVFQFLCFLIGGANLFGQKTVVRGSVIDGETNEPIPFANIVFQHSTSGAVTDNTGQYYLETYKPADSLVASCMSYHSVNLPVKKGASQVINFKLYPDTLFINEVVVTPGLNPAFKILDQISARKRFNNPDRYSSYQYKAYNKIRLDMNNIGDKFKDRVVIKNFQFVFDHMDTSEVFGKNYLPVLISESVSRFYYQKNPSIEREVIDAFKMSGVENKTISQFSGKMYQQFNIYDNFMTLFEPGFVSPIADFGRVYYKYILEDSASIDNSWCYKISFKPKRKMERTFYGFFWVADTSYAIKKMQLRVSPDVNINFLNDLIAIKDFSKINDSLWFLSREELLLDFYLTDKSTGFFGRKTTTIQDVKVDVPLPDSIVNLHTDTYIDEQNLEKDSTYWDQNRSTELSKEDEGVYQMVDSVQKTPIYKRVYSLADLIINYYYVLGPIELGPYYTYYSNNPIEGNRFRVGGRTTYQISKKFRFGGHVAYGLKDERLKYGLLYEYVLNRNPRISTGASYYHDIRQLGKSENAFLDDNILTTLLRRNPNYKLTMVDQYNLYFEREWFQGFSNTITFRQQTVYPTSYVPFKIPNATGDTTQLDHLVSSEVTLSTHFAYREKFLLGNFDHISLGSVYPAVDLDLTYGPKGVLNSQYEYYKIKLDISDKVETNPIGYLRYRITAGKIFGTLPYSLLKLHEGNETYAYDPYAFNMMNYYEFVSDEYMVLSGEQHFQGFFLGHIPLLRRLQLREVVTGKMLIGNLSDKNNQKIMNFPEGLTRLTKPYSEASIGIENIFQVLRIDAMWRFSYLDHPGIQTFSVRAVLQLTF
jgi:hypothetical protein